MLGVVGDTMVLCYHAVSETWTASQSLPEAALLAQVDLLLDRGYRPVSFTEAATTTSRERRVAVTFDDGYVSVLRAAELLADRGVTGTLFVPTDLLGTRAAWAGIEDDTADAELMPWDDVRRLADAGWEIGSHTRRHVHLTRCSEEELADELAVSRAEVTAQVGRPCTSIAYPFGDVDARVLRGVADAGYVAGGALPVRTTAPDALSWPRIGVYHRDADHPWHFRLKVSPGMRALRRSPAWSAYGRTRRALTGR